MKRGPAQRVLERDQQLELAPTVPAVGEMTEDDWPGGGGKLIVCEALDRSPNAPVSHGDHQPRNPTAMR